jgi:hypothetical protein
MTLTGMTEEKDTDAITFEMYDENDNLVDDTRLARI